MRQQSILKNGVMDGICWESQYRMPSISKQLGSMWLKFAKKPKLIQMVKWSYSLQPHGCSQSQANVWNSNKACYFNCQNSWIKLLPGQRSCSLSNRFLTTHGSNADSGILLKVGKKIVAGTDSTLEKHYAWIEALAGHDVLLEMKHFFGFRTWAKLEVVVKHFHLVSYRTA